MDGITIQNVKKKSMKSMKLGTIFENLKYYLGIHIATEKNWVVTRKSGQIVSDRCPRLKRPKKKTSYNLNSLK